MESVNFTSESGPNDNSDGITVVYNSSFADVVWSALSTTTIFVMIIFIVTCIRVLIIGMDCILIFFIDYEITVYDRYGSIRSVIIFEALLAF